MTESVDTTEIERQVELAVQESQSLVITNDVQLEGAGSFLRGIKTILKRIDDTFNEPIQAAHAAHKTMLAAKKKHADPLLQAERAVKGGIGKYQAEQRKLREDEERRLREKAQQEEEERRLAEAEELEKQGEPEAAEELISQPVVAPPVVLPGPPKVAGVSTRTAWKWRMTDFRLVLREFLMVDEKKVNGVVRSMGMQTSIPGIEVYPEEVVSARAG